MNKIRKISKVYLVVIFIILTFIPTMIFAIEPPIQFVKYEIIQGFSGGLAVIKKDGKYGYMNNKGEIVIDLKYDYVESFKNGYARVSRGGFWDEDSELGYCEYVQGKWTFINKEGKEITDFIYDIVWDFNEGYAAVENENGVGYINQNGKLVVDFEEGRGYYNEDLYVKNGIVGVFKNSINKLGYIETHKREYKIKDVNGNIILDCGNKYGFVGHYEDGLIPVAKDGYWGIGAFSIYLIPGAYNDGKWGYINLQGEEIIELIYDYATDLKKGVAFVAIGESLGFNIDVFWGVIDKTGKVIIPIENDDFFLSVNEDLIAIKKDGLWGMYNLNGDLVIEHKYSIMSDFREGISTVQKDGYWGAIDVYGNEVIPFIYNNIWNFSDGLVRVRVEEGGKWGFMDKSGDIVIPPIYKYAFDFKDGVAMVNKDGKFGIIQKPLLNHAKSISINKTELRLVKGTTEMLTATVLPKNAVNKGVIWSSNNALVAKVDKNGLVTAIKEGEAVITATTEDGGYTATCKVVVEKDICWKIWEPKYGIESDKMWTIEFNRILDRNFVTENNVYVTDENNEVVPVFYNQNKHDIGRFIYINPVDDYKSGHTYTLWIKNLKDERGNTLKENVRMDFTII